jgi:phosphoesterase RecJ-like protein
MDAISNVRDLGHVAELLRDNDHYVILPHVSPDPDAYGACCGLALLLTRLGKTVTFYSDEPVPENAEFQNALFPVTHDAPDLAGKKVIFCDGGERKRLPAAAREWDIWMNLDHHEGNGNFATHIYQDTAAAATSLIVARLARELGVGFDTPTATCLFGGLLFDTRGGFITDKSNAEVFRTAADLVEAGARPDLVNRAMNEQMSMGDFQLYGLALAKLGTAAEGRVVYTCLTREMLETTGGGDAAMEMLTLNLPKIAGGEIYVLFKEKKPGLFKLSFRSKGRLAVNTVAAHFDGGGHKFAAGGAVEGTLEEVIARVMAECEKAVRAELSTAP